MTICSIGVFIQYHLGQMDGSITRTYTQSDTGAPDPEISVDLARKATKGEKHRQQEFPRALAPVLGLSVLKAGDVRRLGFTVQHNPNRKNRTLYY